MEEVVKKNREEIALNSRLNAHTQNLSKYHRALSKSEITMFSNS
jgi:hypothetical protein